MFGAAGHLVAPFLSFIDMCYQILFCFMKQLILITESLGGDVILRVEDFSAPPSERFRSWKFPDLKVCLEWLYVDGGFNPQLSSTPAPNISDVRPSSEDGSSDLRHLAGSDLLH